MPNLVKLKLSSRARLRAGSSNPLMQDSQIRYRTSNSVYFSKCGYCPRLSHAQYYNFSFSHAISYIVKKPLQNLYISNHCLLFLSICLFILPLPSHKTTERIQLSSYPQRCQTSRITWTPNIMITTQAKHSKPQCSTNQTPYQT